MNNPFKMNILSLLFITTICLLQRCVSFHKSQPRYCGNNICRAAAATEDVTVQPEIFSGLESFKAPAFEIDRRRNFAIISHPDAGKTTLTEKLLLFGGAIQDAGAVKARGDQRKVTSDWMEIEKARLVGCW